MSWNKLKEIATADQKGTYGRRSDKGDSRIFPSHRRFFRFPPKKNQQNKNRSKRGDGQNQTKGGEVENENGENAFDQCEIHRGEGSLTEAAHDEVGDAESKDHNRKQCHHVRTLLEHKSDGLENHDNDGITEEKVRLGEAKNKGVSKRAPAEKLIDKAIPSANTIAMVAGWFPNHTAVLVQTVFVF